jgi:hypothetical protein
MDINPPHKRATCLLSQLKMAKADGSELEELLKRVA